MQPIQMLIVDDEQLVITSLEYMVRSQADMRVAATAFNGLEALQIINKLPIDIVLLDMQMPIMDGLTFIRQTRTTHPDLPILVLTTFQEKQQIIEALAYGANGYLLKGIDAAKLIQSIYDVLNHQFILPVQVAAKLSQYLLETGSATSTPTAASTTASTTTPTSNTETYHFPAEMFTKKEQEILLLLSSRLRNKEIARQCHISEGTLANNLTNIYMKLNVKNRYDAALAIQAYLNGPGT